MTISSLKKQTKQYASDDQTIAELSQKKAYAESALLELENDTATDIDKLADLASEHNATISDCTFRLNALNKRHALHRTEILALVGEQKESHQQHERDIRKKRSALAQEFIKSEEFQQVMEKLKGLYAAGDYFSFDALLKRNYSEVSGCLSDRFNTARHECRCFTCKQHVQCLGS